MQAPGHMVEALQYLCPNHFRPHQSTRSLRLLSSKMNRNPRNKVIPLWGIFDLRDGMPKSTHHWEYEVGWVEVWGVMWPVGKEGTTRWVGGGMAGACGI